MTISVAKRLYRPAGLSEVGNLVVTLIDGGQQWLDWAMRDAKARYHFSDESALVDGIQTGLHGAALVLLPVTGLLVGPVKLMTLAAADLRVLLKAESGATVDPDQIQAIYKAHDLLPQSSFASARSMLANLGVADAPLFQSPCFDGWRALAGLSDEWKGEFGAAAREAAAFGVDKARTPSEFCDYYRTYLDCARVLALSGSSSQARGAAADAALEQLLPLSFALLDCPKVDGLVAPLEVSAAISEWLFMGRQIGFARASLVVQQVVAHGGYRGQTGMELMTLVRDYVTQAQFLLNANELGRGLLGQDGASCRFSITQGTERAVIELTRLGLITLRSFDPAAPSDPPANTMPGGT